MNEPHLAPLLCGVPLFALFSRPSVHRAIRTGCHQPLPSPRASAPAEPLTLPSSGCPWPPLAKRTGRFTLHLPAPLPSAAVWLSSSPQCGECGNNHWEVSLTLQCPTAIEEGLLSSLRRILGGPLQARDPPLHQSFTPGTGPHETRLC